MSKPGCRDAGIESTSWIVNANKLVCEVASREIRGQGPRVIEPVKTETDFVYETRVENMRVADREGPVAVISLKHGRRCKTIRIREGIQARKIRVKEGTAQRILAAQLAIKPCRKLVLAKYRRLNGDNFDKRIVSHEQPLGHRREIAKLKICRACLIA